MAPAYSYEPDQILPEAARIRDELLEVQTQIESGARQIEVKLVKEARQNLGYSDSPVAAAKALVDARVKEKTRVITPELLVAVLPISETSVRTTADTRRKIEDILKHKDQRLLVVTGPCSIHDPKAALEFAAKVREWRAEYGDTLEIVMRAYVEKPRTELGWKGFVYDPLLDGSNDINLGLVATRMLFCQITDMGVPIAVERLNALTPQYMNGLVSYDVIGARNTTDQKSREYASGSSSPIGFKNPPQGDPSVAPQAMVSASGEHSFLGMGMNGVIRRINTKGNDTGHVILRGDDEGPNYDSGSVKEARDILHNKGLTEAIVIDASHGNSYKKAAMQMAVIDDVCEQVKQGTEAIRGVMMESNINAGAQKLGEPKDLKYGVSITDECVSVSETAEMLAKLSEAAKSRKNSLHPIY
jgi:3-deoxy-7-phosphoheptulonate synthase